ncbi:FtsX-like permease family protein [Alkalibaculum sp. M08DMB]|uniref:FtsX-like permease family protein n=1 Tax=Alkalibaculum sporogenes TaxID=2655001 RepID=A0A6A7K6Y1_9FIRM|nr:FtsX-like permease family protein [Alkalibaculum sporogenes]MPW24873.1 FtsX-like permease family protein [Alkalibaculum sporogenes]
MFDIDIIKLAWMSLWRRKLRTILTMVGIMIGTAGIVIMISLGAGLERTITGEFEEMNMTSIEVYAPYNIMGETDTNDIKNLTKDDVLDLRKLDGVKAVTPIYNYWGELDIGRERISGQLVGVDMSDAEDLGYELEDGRFPRNNEIIIGSKLLEDVEEITGNNSVIRKAVTIITMSMGEESIENEYRSRVVGTLKSTGGNEDYSAVMDIDILIDMVEETENRSNIVQTDGYESIRVVAENTEIVDQLTKEINEIGYMSYSTQDLLAGIGSISKYLQIFLGGIGSIALLVAAIGITNTMIMSIYERTREIGVNKVIGASVKDIRNQFLYEASFIGLMGGVAGLTISYVITLLINFIAGMIINAQAETAVSINIAYIPPWLAIFAITFSIIVGVLAGLYPANRAAKISVLEALRQE